MHIKSRLFWVPVIFTMDSTNFNTRDTNSMQRKSCPIPRQVDFGIGLVIFVLNLPNGQVLFFGEIQITEGL